MQRQTRIIDIDLKFLEDGDYVKINTGDIREIKSISAYEDYYHLYFYSLQEKPFPYTKDGKFKSILEYNSSAMFNIVEIIKK